MYLSLFSFFFNVYFYSMRPLAYIFLLPLFVLFFSSCQKEISGEIARPTNTTGTGGTGGTGGSNFLVKTYTEDFTSASGNLKVTFDLSYDGSKRITSMISRTNAGDKFVYQYGTNKYSSDLYNSNILSIHADFYLNSMQLVDSIMQYNDTADTTTNKFTYNAAKQPIRQNEYEVKNGISTLINTTSYVYDANGNVLKEKGTDGETTYEYGTSLNTLNVGSIYFYTAKHLPKTTTIKGPNAGTITHTYTFDSSNRLTSEKAVFTNGDVAVKTYTY